jgi:hypothetical protein
MSRDARCVHRKADKPKGLEDVKALDLPEGRAIRSLHIERADLGLAGAIDVVEGGEDGTKTVPRPRNFRFRLPSRRYAPIWAVMLSAIRSACAAMNASSRPSMRRRILGSVPE